ncbi:MAG TPA: tetratricopeptide repeat protein, partial [Kofleriaceae bacterium]|nr:tetratricopeptide repeat protein [Kofleriaceae bacterium]
MPADSRREGCDSGLGPGHVRLDYTLAMPRVLFVLTLVVWATTAHADDRDKALKLFEDSDKAYKAGKFEKAAELLREAYGLYPEPELLYNLGRAQEGLGDMQAAVDSYEEYLKVAKKIKDRAAIERRVETLKAQIAKQEEDARQRAEDERRRAEDEERRKREEEERKRNPPPPIDTRTPLEKYGPWITMGAGGAFMVTGVFFGVRASGTHDDAVATPIQRDAVELQASAERSATI